MKTKNNLLLTALGAALVLSGFWQSGNATVAAHAVPTVTPTPTPAPTATATATPLPAPSVTPTPAGSPAPGASPTPSVSPSPTATPDTLINGRLVVRTSGDGTFPVLPQMYEPLAVADFFNDKLVRNKPLAAEFESVAVQRVGASGTITRRTTTKLYRDADGRTRREQTAPLAAAAGIPASQLAELPTPSAAQPTIEIVDPVAGFAYTLDPAARKAYRTRLAAEQQQPPGNSSSAAGPPWDQVPQMIEILRNDAVANNTTRTYRLDQPRSEQLGTQFVQGETAVGRRWTLRIPMNAAGNQLDVETVHEAWYAPALKMLVKSGTRNLLFGEHALTLTRLAQTPQPAGLFAVPTNYQIVQQGEAVPNSVPN